MTTRCKFLCNEVMKRPSSGKDFAFTYDVRLSAVTDGSEDNKKFFAWTPCGILTLTIKHDLFVPGKEYFLDIALAEPAQV